MLTLIDMLLAVRRGGSFLGEGKGRASSTELNRVPPRPIFHVQLLMCQLQKPFSPVLYSPGQAFLRPV